MSETIRIATLVDADSVTTVTRAAYAKWVPVIGREPLPMKADHAAHIRDHRADLLLVDDEVAALVEIIQRHDDLLIENVAVAPAFQKRGYGRKMVAHADRPPLSGPVGKLVQGWFLRQRSLGGWNWSGQRSRPSGEGWHEHFRCRRPVAE